jgi:DNA-directed RNA polymerase specialized sigma24 family protein
MLLMTANYHYSEQAFSIHDELMRLAGKYAPAIAEDVVAEVYCRLHTYDLEGKAIENVQAYAKTMTKNLAITMNKRENRYVPSDDHQEVQPVLGPGMYDALVQGLEGLTTVEKEFLYMYFEEGYTIRECAAHFQVSRSVLQRTRARLLERWAEHQDN